MPKHPFEEKLKDIAKHLQAEIRALHQKEAQGEANQIAIKNDLEAKKQALRQLATFPDEYAREPICFDCWMKQVRSPLRAIGGGTETEDFLKCPRCGEISSEPLP